MFWEIDNEGGMVTCVYSGFEQPAQNASFLDPINTEHTIPQSWFESQEPMRSDIHHLFPTHGEVNQARGNLGFDEVQDSQADEWFVGSAGNFIDQSGQPSSDVDDYSEVHYNVAFEPREEQKGNTARAVFYFFTMYPQFIDSYLSQIGSLEWLYLWHQLDPPDAIEVERNEQIQEIQGNYNPYIYEPDLLGIAWGFVSGLVEEEVHVGVYPNPAVDWLNLESASDFERLEVYDLQGRLVLTWRESQQRLDISSLEAGQYLLRVFYADEVGHAQFLKIDG